MRLFYIILFFCLHHTFANAAQKDKQKYYLLKSSESLSISNKKLFKVKANSGLENENVEKDFVNNLTHKTSPKFILLSSVHFWHLNNFQIKADPDHKILKHNYSFLFKMLYPKHVFW